MTEASLFRKNLIFLDAAQPGVASLVRRSTDTITRAVPGVDGRAVDIDIGAGRFYNQDVDAFAEAQVAAWRGAPMRVVVGRPEPEDLHDPGTRWLSAALSDAAGDALLPIPPADHAGMLVVVGVGLGAHIPLLLEQVAPRHVVLIEPIEEFVVHSLHALDDCAGAVEHAFSFQVIEHVEEPTAFLAEIAELLAPGGRVTVSTPNRGDLLMELLPEDYPPFFYRTVHRWYFGADSLARCGRPAGLVPAETRFVHRFGVANTLLWLRERTPGGRDPLPGLDDPALDSVWRDTLAREGTADTIYMTFEKPLP